MKTKITKFYFSFAKVSKLIFAMVVAAAIFHNVAAQIRRTNATMQESVENLITERQYDLRGLGIVIKNLDDDTVVVSLNPDVMMNPASVQKLITGTAALDLLGPQFAHRTRVFLEGDFNPDSGIVRGNMYLQGGGDPSFSAERLWLFTQHLRHLGIRRVTGDLLIDDFYFDDVGVGPGFSENESRSYQSLISALSASFSSVGVHHRPGAQEGSPVHVALFPAMDAVRINNNARTIAGNRGRLDVTTALVNGTTQVNLNGTIGVDERPGYTYRRVWQTWQSFGSAFRTTATASGIRIDGRTQRRRVPRAVAEADTFYVFFGEPTISTINHMFKWSSNFASEMVFKTMGAERSGQRGSWENGTEAVLEWWASRNLPGTPQVVNGSGMATSQPPRSNDPDTLKTQLSSRRAENLMTASQTVALLEYAYGQKHYFPEYLAAFPSAGVDGTLRTRFNRSHLRGLVRGKTGTLNSVKVSTLAGYMFLDGKTYAFAIFCNNVGPGQFDNWIMQEQILELVSRPGWRH